MAKDVFDLFDAREMESLTALIDKMGKSSFDFLKLENGSSQIIISKNGVTDMFEVVTSPADSPVPIHTAAPASEQLAVSEGKMETAAASATSPPKFAQEIPEEEGFVILRSPSYGLYYAQSAPGKPPYVEIGKAVKKGETVGLFEVMKVFCSIEAPAAGEIADIYVENGQQIEPDMPLMRIKV